MTLFSFLLLFLGGLVAGTMGAMLGLGGGIFLIPFLVLVVGTPMHEAIATSIIAVIATSSTGAAMNVERRIVNIRLGMVLETATVAGAIGGGLTATLLAATVLTKIFASLLLIVSFMMIWRLRYSFGNSVTDGGSIPGSYFDEASQTTVSYTVKRLPAGMAVSLFAGNISGLLGIGGGIFKVPAMHLLCGVPMRAATATSNFMIGVTAAASAFIYFESGHVNPPVVSSAVLGVLLGSFLGVRLGERMNARILTWVFAVVLLFVSLQLYLR